MSNIKKVKEVQDTLKVIKKYSEEAERMVPFDPDLVRKIKKVTESSGDVVRHIEEKLKG